MHSTVQKNLALVEPEDLVSYGFIPEFVGRIPIIASASNLTIDELIEILTEPKNALIKQYQALFAKSGIDLRFHRDAITRIAEIAVTKKTGARGLRRVIEMVLHTALYEYPGTDIGYIVVLESSVNGGTVASFKRGDEEGADMCLYTGVVSVADAKDLPTTWDLLEEICLYEAAVVVEEAAKQD